MTRNYDPYSNRITTGWAYGFPVPNETFSRRDERVIRRAARREHRPAQRWEMRTERKRAAPQ